MSSASLMCNKQERDALYAWLCKNDYHATEAMKDLMDWFASFQEMLADKDKEREEVILKYYIKSNQEQKFLTSILSKQGIYVKGMIPNFKDHPKNSISINVYTIDRCFRFETETTSGLPYTLCSCVTEVVKRTWNTWVEK